MAKHSDKSFFPFLFNLDTTVLVVKPSNLVYIKYP